MAACSHGVEDGAQREVEGDVVFMAAHDAEEVETELCQVEVFD